MAVKLMAPPVAMAGKNLHNVLFIPEKLVFFVANAGPKHIAAEEPCYKYNLKDLMKLFK